MQINMELLSNSAAALVLLSMWWQCCLGFGNYFCQFDNKFVCDKTFNMANVYMSAVKANSFQLMVSPSSNPVLRKFCSERIYILGIFTHLFNFVCISRTTKNIIMCRLIISIRHNSNKISETSAHRFDLLLRFYYSLPRTKNRGLLGMMSLL